MGGMMPRLSVIACAGLLISGCMSGPVPVFSGRAGGEALAPPGPSEAKLPGAPEVRSTPP